MLAARLRGDDWYYCTVLALPLGVCAFLFGLIMEGPSGQFNFFDLYSYSGIVALFILLEGLLLLKKLSVTVALHIVVAAVCCQLFGKLGYLLYFNPAPANFHAELTETFFWMPTVYVLASFMPGLQRVRTTTLVFLALMSGLGLSYVVPNVLQGRNLGVVYALVELALANATLLGLIQVFMGIRERLSRESSRAEMLEQLAYSDSLTELPNRLALETTLQDIIRTRSFYETVGVFFIDIDGFKAVNDSFGHETGDELLKHIADRLRSLGREEDFICRISGDEFIMVFPNLPTTGEVEHVGKRIRSALEQPFSVVDRSLSVSASIGVAVSPGDGDDPATLLRYADAAMYEVKKSGKNGVRRYEPTSEPTTHDRAVLVQELKQAVLGDLPGLTLAYQPIFNDATGRVDKVEALLRWESAVRGAVSPGEFIPLAEEVGLIHKLGSWVLYTACRQAKTWHDQGVRNVRVCVNVSAHQFVQPEFVAVVEDALRASGLPPCGLELELTESVVIHAFERVRECIGALRGKGVAVALDDFGTGYSSLSCLEELEFDTIKLDRSFAQKLARTRGEVHYPVAIVRAVVEIAAVLGVQVVAEGVETSEQRNLFRSLGCTLLQGYCLARPMPAEQVTTLLLEPGPTTPQVLVTGAPLSLN